MSNLVFPAPQPQALGFAWPVKKTPVYSTNVQPTASGRGEVRIGLSAYPRWQFDLDVSYLSGDFGQPSSAFAALLGFYMAAQGKLQDWLYEDPYDNAVVGQNFGTGDGSTVAFQLVRSLTVTGGLDIVQNVNGAPTIQVNGVAVTSYTISSTGLVTFSAAPGAGQSLTWTGGYYFRCRFNDDSLDSLQEDLYQLWSIGGLKFISVIL